MTARVSPARAAELAALVEKAQLTRYPEDFADAAEPIVEAVPDLLADLDDARARLDRIEAILGALTLDGMNAKQRQEVTIAWWDSRHDVPLDDELRVADLALFGAS